MKSFNIFKKVFLCFLALVVISNAQAQQFKVQDLNILGQLQLTGVTGTAGQVLTSNGAASPTWSASGVGSIAQYNIAVGGVNSLTYISPSTAGYVLTSNGPSAYPSYQTISASTFNYSQGSTGSVTRSITSKLQERLSVLDFGCDTTGATDDSTCFANTVAALPSSGGIIYIPAGVYKVTTFPSLVNKSNISFIGAGGVTAGAGGATEIVIAATGSGNFISAASSTHIVFEGIQFVAPSSGFTGYLMAFGTNTSNAAFIRIRDCSFFGSGSGSATYIASGINMDKTIEWSIERSVFGHLSVAVEMAASGSSYSNVGAISENQFIDTAQIPLNGGGNSITINNNTFEGWNNGTTGYALAGSLTMVSTNPQLGLTYINNWHGDVTTNGGTWVSVSGSGLDFSGNFFGGNAASDAITLATTSGSHIHANYFDGFSIAVTYSGTNTSTVLEGNSFLAVTSAISGTAGTNYTGTLTTNLIQSTGGFQLPTTTVSGLPSCTAATLGLQYMVTDATATSFGNTPTGGGSIKISVFCNGSAWAEG
jgi:hypothetical protein